MAFEDWDLVSVDDAILAHQQSIANYGGSDGGRRGEHADEALLVDAARRGVQLERLRLIDAFIIMQV